MCEQMNMSDDAGDFNGDEFLNFMSAMHGFS